MPTLEQGCFDRQVIPVDRFGIPVSQFGIPVDRFSICGLEIVALRIPAQMWP